MDTRIVEAGGGRWLDFHPELMRRTPNTVAAHRVIWLAEPQGVQDAVVEALFRGYFCEGATSAMPRRWPPLADRPAATPRSLSPAGERDGRREVLSEDAMARRSGLNGVPSFVMPGHVLFSGAVPADAMAEAFAKAWRVLSRNAA